MTDEGGRFDPHVPDMASYDIEMRRSLMDKAFFIDKVEADVIVDYGCADGTMIRFLKAMFPEKLYVGYDVSREQVEAARERAEGALVTDDWEEVTKFLADRPEARAAVVANSVVHEVYNYGNAEDVGTFWERLFDPAFTSVVIRDMSVNRATSRMSDPIGVFKVRQRFDPTLVAEFERHWGNLEGNWALVHFLLKYRYTKNWSREVRENYLPLSFEDLIAKVPPGWDPSFVEHYTLPFIRRTVRRDFGLELQDRTHVKLILERTEPS